MIRNRSRAIIVNDERILLIHRIKDNRNYYVFPGGGIEEGEEFENALKRECLEELGLIVIITKEIYRLLQEDGSVQRFYHCLIGGGSLGSGKGPEFTDGKRMRESYIIEKVRMDRIGDLDLYPTEIRNALYNDYLDKGNVSRINFRIIS